MSIDTTNTWLNTHLGPNPTSWYRLSSPNYTSRETGGRSWPGKKARPEHRAQARHGFARLYPV